ATAFFVERIEGKPFIFLEYVSGGDLLSLLQAAPLDTRQTVRLAVQICDGMSHALANGITAHRDLKPNNCLVSTDGILKVTDFGVARVAKGAGAVPINSERRGPVGTLFYMAPEQWDDAFAVNKRADVYAFGIMLYQMIPRRPPFLPSPQATTFAQA